MLHSPIRTCAAFATAALILASAAPRAFAAVPTNFVDELVASGFAEPTGFAFLPDNRLLVTEQRTGNVRMVVNGAATPAILTVPNLSAAANERGLLSVAIDPRWPQSPFVYLFYTRTGGALRLVRYTAGGDLTSPTSTNLTLASPYLLIDDILDLQTNHNGGALRFDTGGFLYLSLGEDASQCSAQDPSTLRGVLMRMDVDGLPSVGGGPATRAQLTPSDNPFVGSSDANTRLVWAYGLRNPFRYEIDAETGKVYLGDVGDATWEEVDEIEAGNNMGWPFFEGFASHSSGCTPPSGFNPRAPIAAYDHGDGIAVMCAGAYRPRPGATSNWPVEYWGDVIYGDYYTGMLRRISWNGSAWVPEPAPGQPNGTDWATGLSFPVDFHVGPDGSLWWASQSGSIRRIRYTGAAVSVDDRATRFGTLSAVSPFSGGTDLAFALERGGRARIAIFDVRGRRVRSLFDQTLGPGARRVRWDGNDDDGRSVPSGLYLIRLEHDGGSAVARALRLR